MLLLSVDNKINISKGYQDYLPRYSIADCQKYWYDNYGYDILHNPPYNYTGISNKQETSIVLVELEMDYGLRIFPLSVLAL